MLVICEQAEHRYMQSASTWTALARRRSIGLKREGRNTRQIRSLKSFGSNDLSRASLPLPSNDLSEQQESDASPPSCSHDVQFTCAINQPLLAHHWRVHQCLLTSRFVVPSIPWGVSAPGGKMLKQLLKDHNFLNNSPILSFLPIFIIESSTFNIYCFSKSTANNTFQFEKLFWIWWKVLATIILWQDVGPCCEQTHVAFEVGLSLDQGQGVYSGWSDVVVSSQLRLCHTYIIDAMVMVSPPPTTPSPTPTSHLKQRTCT